MKKIKKRNCEIFHILINNKLNYKLVNGNSLFSAYSDCNHLDNNGSESEYN